MPVEGGTDNVHVTCQNARWRFDGTDASWLTLSPRSGEADATVTIDAQPNTDPMTGRSMTYAFTCADADWPFSHQFRVTQDSPGYYVIPGESTLTCGASAQTLDVNVDANAQWTAASDKYWLTVTTSASKLTMQLSENTTDLTADRIAHVTLTCGNRSASITVNQQPPNVAVERDEIVYEPEGGVKALDIRSDVAWTASCSQSWINLAPSEGQAGTTQMHIQATANASKSERTANVYINVGGNRLYSIPIRQRGMYVDVSVSSLPVFNYNGGSQTLTITSNTDWTVIDKPNFVSVSPTAGGKGTTNITITAPANNSDKALSGDITFGNANITGLQARVHVEQDCANIGLSEQTITVPSVAGSSHNLTITADQSWTAAFAQGTWAHVTPTAGNGTTTLTLTADDNPSINQREDVLTITPTVTTTPLIFQFIQSGRILEVSTTELTINPKGGTSDPLIITTDGTYEVAKEGEWFTISQSDNTITATATANESEDVREGSITMTMTNLPDGESLTRTITVRQYPPDSIEGGGFSDDKNWDFDEGGSDATITVGGFTDDKNWDF